MTLTDTERILRFLSRSDGKMPHTPLFNKCQYSMSGKTMRTALDSLKAEGLIEERWNVEGHSHTLTPEGIKAAEKALERC